MNKFIEITNRIIAENLKDKIKISSIEYSVIDGAFVVRVKYYTDNFERRAFRYTSYPSMSDGVDLEYDFKCFIERNFD